MYKLQYDYVKKQKITHFSTQGDAEQEYRNMMRENERLKNQGEQPRFSHIRLFKVTQMELPLPMVV